MIDAIDVFSKVVAGIVFTAASPVIIPWAVVSTAIDAAKDSKAQRKAKELKGYLDAMERLQPSVVVLGITGVGKSTLLNTLFGTGYKTGTGKPITGAGLHNQNVVIDGKTLHIYDSCGFETSANNAADRHKLLNEAMTELKSQAITVLYCINAAAGKINDIDVETLKTLAGYRGVSTVVVFTKADMAAEEDADVMRKVLINEGITAPVMYVCSVNEGDSKQFGIDELLDAILKRKE